jgi:hypothetical protein
MTVVRHVYDADASCHARCSLVTTNVDNDVGDSCRARRFSAGRSDDHRQWRRRPRREAERPVGPPVSWRRSHRPRGPRRDPPVSARASRSRRPPSRPAAFAPDSSPQGGTMCRSAPPRLFEDLPLLAVAPPTPGLTADGTARSDWPAVPPVRRLRIVRRGITYWLACRPVTPGCPESDDQRPEVECLGALPVGQASQGASCEPHRNPTGPRHSSRSHRNPTANGTLRYTCYACKGTENSRSAASMRASWTVGAFSG